MSSGRLAIDFGTSFTAAALGEGDRSTVIEVDGSPRLPSAVFLTEDGHLLVGTAAEEEGVLAPDRLERSPKRHLGRERILLGGRPVQVVEMVAAVLSAVWEEAQRRLDGSPPAETLVTHPASWGERRKRALAAAAERAGIVGPVLVSEPEAAALYFADERIAPGDHVAVYDLGGGTFDTAVLRRSERGFEMAGPPGGQEGLGGEGFDERVYRHLADSLATEAPDAWRSLESAEERAWRHARAELHRAARRAKERLSRDSAASIYVPQPVDRELRITRTELEELIRDDVESSLRILEQAIAAARIEPLQLSALYLTGGSSRIPLVASLVRERYGRVDTRDDPKTVVVLGALAAPTAAEEQPTPEVPAPVAAAPPTAPTRALAGAPRPSPERPIVPLARRPWWRRPGAIALVALAALVLAAGAFAAFGGISWDETPAPSPAAEKDHFVAFASPADSRVAAGSTPEKERSFTVGDQVALRFQDSSGDATSYRLCVMDPAGQRSCQDGRTGSRGSFHTLTSSAGTAGSYVAKWYVADNEVASWRYRAEPEASTQQTACPQGTVQGPSGCVPESDTTISSPDCPPGQEPAGESCAPIDEKPPTIPEGGDEPDPQQLCAQDPGLAREAGYSC